MGPYQQADMLIWVTAALMAALISFTWCSFDGVGAGTRIRSALKERHPEILASLAPGPEDHWSKHFAWQNDINAALAALPMLSNIDDDEISRDVVRFRRAIALSVLSLLGVAGAANYLIELLCG
ncbi:MAG: hypothetical protein NW203_12375 [Hyphomonadaceae bacterium]|nr:hypothetical protein [Hyphomonadaceae bacterium]